MAPIAGTGGTGTSDSPAGGWTGRALAHGSAPAPPRPAGGHRRRRLHRRILARRTPPRRGQAAAGDERARAVAAGDGSARLTAGDGSAVAAGGGLAAADGHGRTDLPAACAGPEAPGSPFLARLTAGAESPAPVNYTVIQTAYDTVVTPYQSAFLAGPAARVTNVTLQSACPGDFSGHLAMPTDAVALQWVENALARTGPADPAFQPRCQ